MKKQSLFYFFFDTKGETSAMDLAMTKLGA